MDAQQATSMIDFGASNSPATNVGSGTQTSTWPATAPTTQSSPACAPWVTVNTAAQSSGISTIVRRSNTAGFFCYEGGADPRREGVALGDLYP